MTTNIYIDHDVELELVPLIQPIKEQKAIEEDMYYQLKRLRAKAFSCNNSSDSANLWQEIEEQATQILITRAKSLKVAVWLIESVVYQTGLPGLIFGFKLLYELIERYLENINIDDLVLNTLAQMIYTIPVTSDIQKVINECFHNLQQLTDLLTTKYDVKPPFSDIEMALNNRKNSPDYVYNVR